MDWEEIRQHWTPFESLFKYKWKLLTKDDLHQIDGNKTSLNTKLQEHYGQSKTETNSQIDKFLETFQGILKGKIKISSVIASDSIITEKSQSAVK